LEKHGIDVHKVHSEDGLGLGGEKLPPTRTRPTRCWIDAGVMQDLPHRGGGDPMAKPDQFTLHPPVSQVEFSVAMRITSFLIAVAVGGRPGRRRAV
jgi:hypothetical protein